MKLTLKQQFALIYRTFEYLSFDTYGITLPDIRYTSDEITEMVLKVLEEDPTTIKDPVVAFTQEAARIADLIESKEENLAGDLGEAIIFKLDYMYKVFLSPMMALYIEIMAQDMGDVGLYTEQLVEVFPGAYIEAVNNIGDENKKEFTIQRSDCLTSFKPKEFTTLLSYIMISWYDCVGDYR